MGGIQSNKLHTDQRRFNLSSLGSHQDFAVHACVVSLRALEASVFSELDGTLILPNGRGLKTHQFEFEGTVPVIFHFTCYIGYVGINLGFYISLPHFLSDRDISSM